MAVSTDPRVTMQQKGLEAARKYEKEALERIRRMSLAAADLEVKAAPKKSASSVADAWLEDARRQMGMSVGGSGGGGGGVEDMPMV